ncbi:MAG: polyprenyl synthetase family protein [Candidatus Bipolaricaulia bacterium]
MAATANPLIAQGAPYVRNELGEIEAILRERLDSDVPAVAELGQYVVDSGGKRFRPAISILLYKLLGERGEQRDVLELATVVELIHLATLAHDDVIDHTEERRDRPSLWKRSSNRSAILEGDFIFSRAFGLLNPHREEIRALIIDTVDRVLEGELLQESLRGDVATDAQYDQVNEGKTAVLIGAACAVGAMVGDPELDRDRQTDVYEAGVELGLAYQMIDDLLDVFGDDELGKPRWSDWRGGWLTWPFLELIRREPESADRLLNAPLGQDDQAALTDRMRSYGIPEQLRERAQSCVDRAQTRLAWLAESEMKRLLLRTFDFAVGRNR